MSEDVFHQKKQPIEGFVCTCTKCGSKSVRVEYQFNYYGGWTGWDSSLAIVCDKCGHTASLET